MDKKVKIDRKRHIFKAITWRIVASLTTFLLVFLTTKELIIGVTIGILDIIIKIILYYLHERVWYKSNFGIKRKNKKKNDILFK